MASSKELAVGDRRTGRDRACRGAARRCGRGAGPGARGRCGARPGQGAATRSRASAPSPPLARPGGAAPRRADVIVECLPPKHFAEIARAGHRARPHLHAAVGGRADRSHGPRRPGAPDTGARIVVPTGALLGLDAVRAAAEGKIASATIVTRKPPAGLAGAPLLVAARPVGGGAEGAAAGVRRQRARGHRRLPRQRQRGRGAVARRHRAGPARRWRCGPTRA